MHFIDWTQVVSAVIPVVIGGIGSWLVTHIGKLMADLNACFEKVRRLEERVYGSTSGPNDKRKGD